MTKTFCDSCGLELTGAKFGPQFLMKNQARRIKVSIQIGVAGADPDLCTACGVRMTREAMDEIEAGAAELKAKAV